MVIKRKVNSKYAGKRLIANGKDVLVYLFIGIVIGFWIARGYVEYYEGVWPKLGTFIFIADLMVDYGAYLGSIAVIARLFYKVFFVGRKGD